MSKIILLICLLSSLRLSAEGCSRAGLQIGNHFSRTPGPDAIGTLYYPPYSTYNFTAHGNITCNYSLKTVRVFLNGILLAKRDTNFSFKMHFAFGAYPGRYTVEIELWNPPGIAVWEYEIASNPVGLKELANQPTLLVYPNPSHSFITVDSEGEIRSISLITASGEVIMTQDCGSFQIQIPLTEYPPGVYFLSVAVLQEKPLLRKIVIQ